MPEKVPNSSKFDSRNLDSAVIAIPLLEKMKIERGSIPVIIDANLFFEGGDEGSGERSARERAKNQIRKMLTEELGQPVESGKIRSGFQYIFVSLNRKQIIDLIEIDGKGPEDSEREGFTPEQRGGGARQSGQSGSRAVYRIWLDHDVSTMLTKSVQTVKANAAQISFQASGKDIVWAVVDTGVEINHMHFRGNYDVPKPLKHQDFTGEGNSILEIESVVDENGHGTHVAGIIAGRNDNCVAGIRRQVGGMGSKELEVDTIGINNISGIAPDSYILSLRVLDSDGKGKVSNIIRALEYIQEVNAYGRKLHVHGVNLSVGYEFDARWFACGQSPLCVEVDRLVRSGVVVVVAAGNSGYGRLPSAKSAISSGLEVSINDPGNASLAITVGSTHRTDPHTYGVSYFSSKGPTGDGRLKPDLVAPGERIISAAAGNMKKTIEDAMGDASTDFDYIEESGTSMAAPHVSGAIAAFLSIRPEFIGQPEKVKQIFLSSATDLGRERYYQGYGLVDLMRAIQSI